MWVVTLSHFNAGATLLSRVNLSLHESKESAQRWVTEYTNDRTHDFPATHYDGFSEIKYPGGSRAVIDAEFIVTKE